MNLNWYHDRIELKKKSFVVTFVYSCEELFGTVFCTYDRMKKTWKYQIQQMRNEIRLVGDSLENFILGSLKEDKDANKHMFHIESFNGHFQKELEKGEFNLESSTSNRYKVVLKELKNYPFILFTELDEKHNIEKLWMLYEGKVIEVLSLMDENTYMKMNEKIHHKLRIRELFNKEDEL